MLKVDCFALFTFMCQTEDIISVIKPKRLQGYMYIKMFFIFLLNKVYILQMK